MKTYFLPAILLLFFGVFTASAQSSKEKSVDAYLLEMLGRYRAKLALDADFSGWAPLAAATDDHLQYLARTQRFTHLQDHNNKYSIWERVHYYESQFQASAAPDKDGNFLKDSLFTLHENILIAPLYPDLTKRKSNKRIARFILDEYLSSYQYRNRLSKPHLRYLESKTHVDQKDGRIYHVLGIVY